MLSIFLFVIGSCIVHVRMKSCLKLQLYMKNYNMVHRASCSRIGKMVIIVTIFFRAKEKALLTIIL